MNILDELEYLEDFSDLLSIPIIGREKGQWLLDLVHELNPRNVLELGTAIGYSATILSSLGAIVVTIDRDFETTRLAEDTFNRFFAPVELIVGDGLQILMELSSQKNNIGRFDLIFLDFEKRKYVDAMPMLLDMLATSGIIVADNIDNPKMSEFLLYIGRSKELNFEKFDIGDGMMKIYRNTTEKD